MKTCTKCGETKVRDAFTPRRSACKACLAAYNAAYRAANPEKVAKYRANNAKYQAAYRAANPEKNRMYGARCREVVTPAYVAALLKLPVVISGECK